MTVFFKAEFSYNNAENASISQMLFKFTCGYHPYLSYKKNLDLY